MLAAALAVTAVGLAAGVLTPCPAHATPPAGITTEILGSGTTLADFKIHIARITAESEEAPQSALRNGTA